ncbi:MAG: c-type cytochrome, partial [Chloroflexi bacterium]|nr:c-type cytochrome [Chloroflexota bacterium]
GLALADPPSDPATLSKGGQLYDKWWTVAGAAKPTTDQPLWATQTTNTRNGSDTWRCKECHGWDYRGKDGAYGSGSHRTGFTGVVNASQTKSQEEIAAILKGSANPSHNFSTVLDDASINALAAFLKDGVIDDLREFIDYSTKKPKSADASHGKQLYANTCATCHGSDGRKLNFGSDQEPEYIGTIASDNPQEFVHKVRFGQPGAPMPAGVQSGWSMQDVLDVLAHAQTLPATAAPTRAGAETYAQECAVCHGRFGEGLVGPPLHTPPPFIEQMPLKQRQQLFTQLVRGGVPGEMPGFTPEQVNNAEVIAIEDFLGTLTRPLGRSFLEAAEPVSAVPSTADRIFFPQTGHTLSFGFKAFFEMNGGEAAFGLPLTEEFTDISPTDGKPYTMQMFERARFERHADMVGTPFEIQLGLQGAESLSTRLFHFMEEE